MPRKRVSFAITTFGRNFLHLFFMIKYSFSCYSKYFYFFLSLCHHLNIKHLTWYHRVPFKWPEGIPSIGGGALSRSTSCLHTTVSSSEIHTLVHTTSDFAPCTICIPQTRQQRFFSLATTNFFTHETLEHK